MSDNGLKQSIEKQLESLNKEQENDIRSYRRMFEIEMPYLYRESMQRTQSLAQRILDRKIQIED